MDITLSITDLWSLALACAISTSHLWLAIWGFQSDQLKGAAKGMFSLTLIIMAWSVFVLSFGHAGFWELYPPLIVASPMVSGFAPPAFFIFCASVTSPNTKWSRKWLITGLLGIIYSICVLMTDGGPEQIVAFATHKTEHIDPLFYWLFTIHSIILALYIIASTVLVVKAYWTTKTLARKQTLKWLFLAILVGYLLILSGNILPLLGFTKSISAHALVTLPMTFLAYQGLKSHVEDVKRYSLTEDQARKELHATIGRVVRGVAHEINNMLTSIVGNSELIRMKASDDSIRDRVESIILASNKTSSLLNRMVMFSGKGDNSARTDKVTEIVSSAAWNAAKNLGRTDDITVDVEENLPPVKLRSSELREAVEALIFNGFESNNGGDVKVTVRVSVDEEPVINKDALGADITGCSTIRLTVTDNGDGMTRKVIRKAVEPFFTTRKNAIGFGLTKVFASVQQCHGAMYIESSVGEGTTVNCWLPATDIVTSSRLNPVVDSAGNILIVDDEPSVSKVLKQMVEVLGFSTIIQSSAEDTIKMMSGGPKDISLALIDVNLSGENGIELTKRLVSNGVGFPILLMSGDEPGDINQLNNGGVSVKFIRKPIPMNTLKEILAEL